MTYLSLNYEDRIIVLIQDTTYLSLLRRLLPN
jgi:hypothetical protein